MNIKQTLFSAIISIVVIFAAISFITLPKLQTDFFHVPLISKLTESTIFSDALLFMMSSEVPQLEGTLEENGIETPKLSTVLFEAASGITLNNFSSLLDLELPGLNTSSNQIQFAGNNADSTNTPIESPPPDFEDLLKEDTNEEEKEPPKKENETDQQEADVFVYHSHSWEAFLPLLGEEKTKPSDASSTDNDKNIVMVGSLLTEQLEKQGMTTFHDTTNVTAGLHEQGWDYYDSYKFSRETVQEAMATNDKAQYFIDIHRDAQRKDITTTTINDKPYAKLYFIVGIEHENYKQNLEFVEKLNNSLEQKYPGVSRGIFLKDKSEGNGVYNQDLSANSILIEIGGVDNNKEELNNTSEALAEVIADYHFNAEKVDTNQ
ncbi:hypothetical protein M948_16820 [Virgibacillus sp. CM-4]|uniref:stage II sporulation protein P n=1 Tax=Virgibacillus sp. CM-4 TaxID=1354277 RepID=UPI0003888BD6|nr:stage II sporulation protein P [Virgibacillus sp. CM-4]EQB36695.1 hypothetical protein M948_16820 [Virgibacillus sp. CM-4]